MNLDDCLELHSELRFPDTPISLQHGYQATRRRRGKWLSRFANPKCIKVDVHGTDLLFQDLGSVNLLPHEDGRSHH